jgi:integrase
MTEAKRSKMKGRRTIGLDAATVAVIRAHKARQAAERLASGPAWTDTGLVFTAEDGQGLHPNAVNNAFGRILRGAGLPRIRFHDLRHSYATAALEAGEDLKVVSARLGHSGYSITADLYVHVQPHVDHGPPTGWRATSWARVSKALADQGENAC